MKFRSHDAFMGVSLSNQRFSKRFAKNLCRWINRCQIRSFEIVVFDKIEAINYRVFREIADDEALKIASARALELKSMFDAVLAEHTPQTEYCCVLQSVHDVEESTCYRTVLEALENEYSNRGAYAKDVHAQVLNNLQARINRHGEDFVMENISDLVTYVIQEVAFFECLWRTKDRPLEVYPGSTLFVKERLWCGNYPGLQDFVDSERLFSFIDVTFLTYSDYSCRGLVETSA